MATRALSLCLTLCLAPSLPSAAHGQETTGTAGLAGRVVLGLTGDPVAGAEVDLSDRDRTVLTSEDGTFRFRGLSPGSTTVLIRYLGKTSFPVTVRLVPGVSESVELAIAGPMFQMEDILVEVRGIAAAKMRGFEERRTRRPGFFITRQDIAEGTALYPSNLLDGVGGARAVQDQDGRRKVMVGAGRNACEPDLYVDGSPASGAWLDDYLVNLIEAIELYPRWHMRPPQFRDMPRRDYGTRAPTTQEMCGAIVMWTRESR